MLKSYACIWSNKSAAEMVKFGASFLLVEIAA
jgi:hypothetical protein